MIASSDRFWRAVETGDPRFDGWVFAGVTSTGIYCRPSCPARTPKRENVRFYPTAAAAQADGFRACKRCRPDAAPGSPEWDRRNDLVGRAMRLIADGVVDRHGVAGLASRLGCTERHLHGRLSAVVGAGPLALARAQRAQTARLLLEHTELPMIDVASSAGFGSVRQFGATVREIFATTPRDLRSRGKAGQARTGDAITLHLPHRAPLDAAGLVAFLGRRAVPGVEEIVDGAYRRSMRLPHAPGIVELRAVEGQVRARFWLTDLRDLATAVQRSRVLLDLDSDPEAVADALGTDATLGRARALRPGPARGRERGRRRAGHPRGARAAGVAGRRGQRGGAPDGRPR